MDFNKSSAILKKINALHDSASSFDGRVSAMERDLLKHYLRELYELISVETAEKSPEQAAPVMRSQVQTAPVAPAYDPHMRDASPPPHYENFPSNQARYQESYPKAPIQAPVYSQGNGHHPYGAPDKAETTEPKVDEALAALFDMDTAKDHSSRFSQLPISDIGKSMGINDRILTVNELFGGDQLKFNQVVRELNGLKSFDEAKEYLIKGVASEMDWASPSKSAKAEVFIKLIRRRYL